MAAKSVPPSVPNSFSARLRAYFQLAPLSLGGSSGLVPWSGSGESAASSVASIGSLMGTGCPLLCVCAGALNLDSRPMVPPISEPAAPFWFSCLPSCPVCGGSESIGGGLNGPRMLWDPAGTVELLCRSGV
ncbi:hypothetical protein ACFFX0_19975 [Citricoccus parietis]|uniref:Uncharacterized protein n=1 Tax=Citricoccus parietis TaxID=592307 RepID=A0ABV5G344_9MICC